MRDTIEGRITVTLNVSIDPWEMAQWPPECVHQLFRGLALVHESIGYARATIGGSLIDPSEPASSVSSDATTGETP